VTDSISTRFVISMIALFNTGIKGFSSAQWTDALDWSGLKPAERERLASVLKDFAERYPTQFALLKKVTSLG